MKEKYKNLIIACNIFTEEYDLSLDQNIESLSLSIDQGYIDYKSLKEEYEKAINNPNFKWIDLALESKLLTYSYNEYDDGSIKEYVEKLIGDYLRDKDKSFD